MLFFTAPPLNVEQPFTYQGRTLGHSARYLAAKAQRDAAKASKRKADEAGAAEREENAKRTRIEEEKKLNTALSELNVKALRALEDQLAASTRTELEAAYDAQTKEGLKNLLDRLTVQQQIAARKRIERELHEIERLEGSRMKFTGMTGRLEDKI